MGNIRTRIPCFLACAAIAWALAGCHGSNGDGGVAPPATDSFEPNDTLGTAFILGNGVGTYAITGHIDPLDDEDWFSVQVPAGAMLTATLSDLPADYDLFLYDFAADVPVAVSSTPGTTDENITYGVGFADLFFIQVVPFGKDSSATDPYTLTVDVLPAIDPLEPNDSPVTATPLPVGPGTGTFSQTALLETENDQDWFSFTADFGVLLDINLATLPDDFDIFLYDDDGNLLDYSIENGTADEQILYTVPAAGTYFVLVLAGSPGASSAVDSYALTVTIGSPVDPFEPNEAFGTAFPLGSLGTHVVDALISPLGDEDWFQVSGLLGGDAITAGLTNLAADYDLELYDSDGVTLLDSSNEIGMAPESLTFPVTAAGTYYVHVFSAAGAADGAVPYVLTVDVTCGSCTSDPFEPNDLISQPFFLGSTGAHSVTAYLDPAFDEDLFQVQASAGETLTVWLSNLPDDYDLELLDSTGLSLRFSRSSGPADELIIYQVTADGDYIIRVFGWAGASTDAFAYNLDVRVE